MIDQNLNDYIKQASTQGIPKEKIKQELLKAGWQESEINIGFDTNNKPSMPYLLVENKNKYRIDWQEIIKALIFLVLLYYSFTLITSYLRVPGFINETLPLFTLFTAVIVMVACAYGLLLIFLCIFGKITNIEGYKKTLRFVYLMPILIIFSYVLMSSIGWGCVYERGGLCDSEFFNYLIVGINLPFFFILIINTIRLLKPFKIILIITLLISVSLVSLFIFPVKNNLKIQKNNELFSTIINTNDQSNCEKLTGSEIARCLVTLGNENFKLRDTIFCEKISKYNLESGEICFTQIGDCEKATKITSPMGVGYGPACFKNLAIANDDPAYCETIKTLRPDLLGWTADCYFDLFQKTKELKYCQDIMDILGEKEMKSHYKYINSDCKVLLQ